MAEQAAQELHHVERQLRRELIEQACLENPSVLLTLRSGAGGTDAEHWADMLGSMYLHLARHMQWKVKLLDMVEGRAGGVRSVTWRVRGKGAFALLRHEHGSHRVAHHSSFGKRGKRQTSFCSVEVLPDNRTAVQALDMRDVQVTTYAGSSKGGQHANRSSTNVRMVHLPTGVTAQAQGRSLTHNQQAAQAVLAARVRQAEEEQRSAETAGTHVSARFGQRIRSYTFTPYQMVSDDRIGHKTRQLDEVMHGGPALQDLMFALLAHHLEPPCPHPGDRPMSASLSSTPR